MKLIFISLNRRIGIVNITHNKTKKSKEYSTMNKAPTGYSNNKQYNHITINQITLSSEGALEDSRSGIDIL